MLRLSYICIRLAAVVSLLGTAPTFLLAQGDSTTTTAKPTELNPLTVTAERRPVRASASAATVRVIDSREVASRAATDLTQILGDIPGLTLEPVVGSGAGISMQGLGSDRVLILLDGTPLVGRLSGQLDLTRLAPAIVERIEVVEGPQSTFYGSSALGGVVNIITRRDSRPRGELAVQAGSFDQRDVRGRASGLLGGTGLSLDVGRRSLDVAPGTAARPLGFANRWDGMARATRAFGSSVADLRVLRIQENQEYRTGTTNATRNLNDNWQTDALATVTFGSEGRTEVRAHASLYDHRFQALSATATPPQWSVQNLVDLEAVRHGTFGARAHSWVVGARGDREWLESPRVLGGERSSWAGAIYAAGDWRVGDDLAVTTGARFTTSEVWGSDVAPRVGITWQPFGPLYAKAGLARGFRAPSFNELYLDFLQSRFFYSVQGNPDLDPEHSWNLTGEVGLVRDGLSLYLRGYGNRLRDFIETTQARDSAQIAIFTYQNVGEARTAGLETGATIAQGPWTVAGSYAFLDTENQVSGEDLLGRAAHTAKGSLGFAHGRLALRTEGIRVGRVPLSRSPEGAVTYQDAHTRINAGGTFTLPAGLSLIAGVDNLTDELPAGSATVIGRRWYGGLSWGIGK